MTNSVVILAGAVCESGREGDLDLLVRFEPVFCFGWVSVGGLLLTDGDSI